MTTLITEWLRLERPCSVPSAPASSSTVRRPAVVVDLGLRSLSDQALADSQPPTLTGSV